MQSDTFGVAWLVTPNLGKTVKNILKDTAFLNYNCALWYPLLAFYWIKTNAKVFKICF